MSKDEEVNVKLMTIGDGAVGKTSLLMSYAQNKFPDEYTPTVFDNYNCTMMYKDLTVVLGLWDTAGQQDYETLRPLAFPGTHVFLICFSVISRASFSNVESVWVNEMKTHCANTPFVLCGTKVDLLDDPEMVKKLKAEGNPPILEEEGKKLAKKLGAHGYVACSGKTQKGLLDVFEMCAEAGLIKQGILKPSTKNDDGNSGGKKKDCILQ